MKTIILPGFSLKNKDWAENTKVKLEKHFPTTVYYWKHWETEKPEDRWIEKEARRIIEVIKSGKINLLVKSIGTAVAMVVLKTNPSLIHKLVLCGIPINDFLEGDEKYYEVLKTFSNKNIVCFQNANDNHGSYDQAKELIESVNPDIKIVKKPRSDHEYPYWDDFIKFLK